MIERFRIAAFAAAFVMSLPTQAGTAPHASTWIVGAWVFHGETCQGDTGITFDADGTYRTYEQTGRWSLAGNTLSLTPVETYVMGEPGSERRVRNPRPVFHQILSRGANAYSSRGPGGAVGHMVRCR